MEADDKSTGVTAQSSDPSNKVKSADTGARSTKRVADKAKSSGAGGAKGSQGSKAKAEGPKTKANRVRKTRIERMMSKAELARRANLSVLTIDRVEKGLGCRMDTKRKILEALGLNLVDRVRVFGEEE